jgi:hypothetical protein
MEGKVNDNIVDQDTETNEESGAQKSKPVFKTLTYAKLLEKQGYISEAIQIYEDLLSTYPREEVVRRNLDRLKRST